MNLLNRLKNYSKTETSSTDSSVDSSQIVREIEELYINMHYLINEYRPHHARHILIGMMQHKIDRITRTTQILDSSIKQATTILSLTTEDIHDNEETVIREVSIQFERQSKSSIDPYQFITAQIHSELVDLYSNLNIEISPDK